MNWQIFLAFLFYFSILLTIGLLSRKKNTSEADFVVGGRGMNFWVTALSAHASDMSSWLFMAFPMAVFVGGMSKASIGLGLVIGMYLNWQFVAPRLRAKTEEYDSYTLSTFFEKRFNDHSGLIRIISGTMIIFFMTCYLAAGLIGMGYLFESVFNIGYAVGIIIALGVAITYTTFGGFVAIAWTDMFQGVFLFFVITSIAILGFISIDGTQAIRQMAEAKEISLAFFPDYSMSTILGVFLLAFGWGLGYFGQPHIITKFMGIKSVSELKKSQYLGISWQVGALAAAAIIGLIGIAYFPAGLENPELVFVVMVKSLMSPFVAGFILCAVLAATISTMDSQMLVTASVFSEDFYKRIVGHKASQEELLKVSRFGVVAVSGVALMIALARYATILDTVAYAWSGLGSSFGPLVLTSLYSKKTNKYGAMAGILVGGVVSATWPTLNLYYFQTSIMPIIPGFFSGLASIYVVTMMTSGWVDSSTNAKIMTF